MIQPPHIIFVDDEINILEGLRRSLKGKIGEWQMDFAMGGEEALKLMNAHPYDLIVTDMKMPGMSGEELLGKVIPPFSEGRINRIV